MFEAILYYTLPSLAFTLLISLFVRPAAEFRTIFAVCVTAIVSVVAFNKAYAVATDYASKLQGVYPSLAAESALKIMPVILTLGFVLLAVMLPCWAAAFCAPDVFSKRRKTAQPSSSR